MPPVNRNGHLRHDVSRLLQVADPRELPAYSVPEAAQYLQIPLSTLRSWVVGRNYPVRGGAQRFRPLLKAPAGSDTPLLSFFNLVEAHVLDSIRHVFRVDLAAVRRALTFVERRFPSPHPLADRTFETDGKDLFIRELGDLISASEGGQLGFRDILDAHLRRIDRDERGVAERLFLFTRGADHSADEPRAVVVDARLSFGRPVLAGTGVPTAVIAERFKAAESVEDLASDYGRTVREIQEALRCELLWRAA